MTRPSVNSFQHWVNELWTDKDNLLDAMSSEALQKEATYAEVNG